MIKNISGKNFHEILYGLSHKAALLKTKYWYKIFFAETGKGSKIFKPLRLTNPGNIFIKESVIVNKLTWLLTLQINPDSKPELIIDSGATIGYFNHITCVSKVYIGKNVLTADKVLISDNSHGYEDISTPIVKQPVISGGEVFIGEGTWIGENVSVLSCRIGKHCVIAANSVVNSDVPDFSVAAGMPAKIVKRYNFETNKWEKTNREGEFSDE